MPWVRLDDQFFANPKVIELGKDAKLLYLAGLTYCGSQLTDGAITAGAIRMIAATVDVDRGCLAELVAVGLWHETAEGFQVHDYLEYNPSAEKVRGERDAAKQRMQRLRSPEVRPNEREKFARSSPSPSRTHPVPIPSPLDEVGNDPQTNDPPAASANAPESEPGEQSEASLPGAHGRRFDAFWSAYPKKVGRKVCLAWWQRRRPNDELTQVMLDAIAAHRAGDQWRRGFIKDPIRWLQEERWQDEIAPEPVASRAAPAPRGDGTGKLNGHDAATEAIRLLRQQESGTSPPYAGSAPIEATYTVRRRT